jgi:SAM-dependent MidA family methyltransferase
MIIINFFMQGYYIHRDVFGKDGDFTTSPEISQMFGEVSLEFDGYMTSQGWQSMIWCYLMLS